MPLKKIKSLLSKIIYLLTGIIATIIIMIFFLIKNGKNTDAADIILSEQITESIEEVNARLREAMHQNLILLEQIDSTSNMIIGLKEDVRKTKSSLKRQMYRQGEELKQDYIIFLNEHKKIDSLRSKAFLFPLFEK